MPHLGHAMEAMDGCRQEEDAKTEAHPKEDLHPRPQALPWKTTNREACAARAEAGGKA